MINRHSLRRWDAEFEEKGWLLRMIDLNYHLGRCVHVLICFFRGQLLALHEFDDKLVKIPRAEGLACTYVIIQEQSSRFHDAHVLHPPHDSFTTKMSDTGLDESSLSKGDIWRPQVVRGGRQEFLTALCGVSRKLLLKHRESIWIDIHVCRFSAWIRAAS